MEDSGPLFNMRERLISFAEDSKGLPTKEPQPFPITKNEAKVLALFIDEHRYTKEQLCEWQAAIRNAKGVLVSKEESADKKYPRALESLGLLPSGHSRLTNGDKKNIRSMIARAQRTQPGETVRLDFSEMCILPYAQVNGWDRDGYLFIRKSTGHRILRDQVVKLVSELFNIETKSVEEFIHKRTLSEDVLRPYL